MFNFIVLDDTKTVTRTIDFGMQNEDTYGYCQREWYNFATRYIFSRDKKGL